MSFCVLMCVSCGYNRDCRLEGWRTRSSGAYGYGGHEDRALEG